MGNKIFITLGSQKFQFNRLLEVLIARLLFPIMRSGGSGAVKANKKFSDLSFNQIRDRARNRNLRNPRMIFENADKETKKLFAELYASGGSAAVQANEKFSELSRQQITDRARNMNLRSPRSISMKVKEESDERK